MNDKRKGPAGDADAQVELVTVEDFELRSRDLSKATASDQGDEDSAALTATAADQVVVEGERKVLVQRKADLQLRSLGRAIDLVIFAVVAESVSYLGPVVALAYLLLADGLFDGASLGKKISKLRVIRTKDGQPAKLFDSLMRNAPLGIAGLFMVIPIVGWALFLTLGLALILFESYMLWKDPYGIRAGDILAGTQVVSAVDERPAVDLSSDDDNDADSDRDSDK